MSERHWGKESANYFSQWVKVQLCSEGWSASVLWPTKEQLTFFISNLFKLSIEENFYFKVRLLKNIWLWSLWGGFWKKDAFCVILIIWSILRLVWSWKIEACSSQRDFCVYTYRRNVEILNTFEMWKYSL